MKSIRRHLTVRLVAATSLLAIAGMAAVFVYLRGQLIEQFDRTLAARAGTLASLVRIDDDTHEVEFESPGQAAGEDWFQIWGAEGEVLARSDSVTSAKEEVFAMPPGASPREPGGRFFDLTLPDGRAGRAIEFTFYPAEEGDAGNSPPRIAQAVDAPLVTLVLAGDMTATRATLQKVLAAVLVVIAAMAVGMVLTVVATVRRGLRPLREIGDSAARIDPATLQTRFDHVRLPSELRPIVGKLNELLARLDDAFQRERRFTSNVAHELRTPIAELRSLAEVALKWPEDGETSARNFHDVLNIARQMQAIVAALLAIARTQAGQQPLSLVPIDLSEAALDVWRAHEVLARKRGLDVEIEIAPQTIVVSDRAVLSAMLSNLFANAATYTPAGGRIACRCRNDSGASRCVLEISNTNESLVEKDLPLLSEPFWRKDAARGCSDNSGLGLTLVATYAELLDIGFSIALPSSDTVAATLEIPLHSEAVRETADCDAEPAETATCEVAISPQPVQ